MILYHNDLRPHPNIWEFVFRFELFMLIVFCFCREYLYKDILFLRLSLSANKVQNIRDRDENGENARH